MTPTWDLKSAPTAKLLDMLHEYSQAHAAVSDKKGYSHPDAEHYKCHFYNMRWAVARELERRGYKFNLLPLVQKSVRTLLSRPPVDPEFIAARLHKSLGPGERWITVHPHGDDEPGIPVLIKERPDGSAHIIGGAGGSLNFVRLTNLKSPEEYRAHAKVKNAEKRAKERERLAELSPEEREVEQQHKARVKEEKRSREDAEVARVYKLMGKEAPVVKDAEQLAADNNIPLAAAKIAVSRERRAHITAVKQLANALRETLVDDHELAAEAGLGDISLRSTADKGLWNRDVAMEDVQPDKTSTASGIKTDFKGRAEGAGGTKESVGEEGKLVKERAKAGMDPKQREFTDRVAQNIKDWNAQAKELENTGQVKNDVLKIDQLPEPEKMLEILKADRNLATAGQRARAAMIGDEEDEPKNEYTNPYVVDTSDTSDATVVKQMVKEVELKAVRAMLSRVEETEGLTRHVRNAAFDQLNNVGLTLSGQELMGREVVDFLGPAGAAQLMAQRLRQTLSDEDFETVAAAVAGMHGRDNAAQADEALKAADGALEAAKQLEAGVAEDQMDLVAARSLNEKRQEHIANAREILGDAYGRLSAMGMLSMALKGATREDQELRVDMGGVEREQAITMARSFGLNPEVSQEEADAAGVDTAKIGHVGEGDYRIDSTSGKTYITLKPSALSKVVSAFDPQDTKHYEAAQTIKRGEKDEEGWLPAGIEKRPATSFNDPSYKPGQFDTRLELKPDMTPAQVKEALQDYIGARIGEGYPFDALRSDMHSAEFLQNDVPAAHAATVNEELAERFPQVTGKGLERVKGQEAADSAALAQAQQFSADYKRKRGMTDADLVSLHSQQLPINEAPEQFAEAAHRTLAALPQAKAAFTKLGDLDHEDKTTLRDFFLQHFTQAKPQTEQEKQLAARQRARDQAKAAEPKKEAAPEPTTDSLFGADEPLDTSAKIGLADNAKELLAKQGVSEEQYRQEQAERLAKQKQQDNPSQAPQAPDNRTPEQAAWDNYVSAMGGHQQAYETVQSILRGHTVEEFAKNYGRVFGRPLKVGREDLPNWERHVTGQLPEEKLKQVMGDRAAEAQSHMASLAKRSGGKFAKEDAAGDRRKAYDALRETMHRAQGSLHKLDQFPRMDRPTLGQDAEKQLQSVWGNAAEQFDAKKGSVKLVPDLAMDGKTIKQQRAVKLALQQRRLGLHMGAGSGKSITAIGTFTEMHDKGMAKKGVFAVPSVVQGQFGAEMLRFTTPGKYKWLADPKATREERFAAYADDNTHMVVTTHQAFRDDLVHAMAQAHDKTPEEIAGALGKMSPEGRRAAMKAATEKLGWKIDFLGVDEAHGITNRAGKPDSTAANAIDSFSYHMPNYLSMTGTPVKNDASEAFDTLAKLDPARFKDRDSFMRKYGVNTPTNWQSLQRLMARYVYTDRISSGVERFTEERKVPLHPEQQKEYSGVMSALNKVRRTRRGGKDVDLNAMKTLAPDLFTDAPEENHQQLANEAAHVGLGGRLNARLHSIVNGADYEHNAKINAMREDLSRDKDKPHVIFAHHYKSISHIKRLCGELGLKAGVITGEMSAGDKAKVRRGFQPEDGSEPQFDVLVNSDAGSTGQNLQRASIVLNYDTPDTAMTHEQRAARADRLGQQHDVTVRDYVTDTPFERRARKRLATKYALADVFQSPSEMLDDTGLAGEIQRVRAKQRNMPKAAAQAAQNQSDQFDKIKAAVNEAPARKQAVGESPEAAPVKPKAAPAADGLREAHVAGLKERAKQTKTAPAPVQAAEPTEATGPYGAPPAATPPQQPLKPNSVLQKEAPLRGRRALQSRNTKRNWNDYKNSASYAAAEKEKQMTPREKAERDMRTAQQALERTRQDHARSTAAFKEEWDRTGKQPAGYEKKMQELAGMQVGGENFLRDAQERHARATVDENAARMAAEKKAETKARRLKKSVGLWLRVG